MLKKEIKQRLLMDDDLKEPGWVFQGNYILELGFPSTDLTKYFSRDPMLKEIGYHPKPILDQNKNYNPLGFLKVTFLREEDVSERYIAVHPRNLASLGKQKPKRVIRLYTGDVFAIYTKFEEQKSAQAGI